MESKSAFLCDSGAELRSSCEGLPFYGEYEGNRYCVLHYPADNKQTEFREAVELKLNNRDYDFSGAWFPSDAVRFDSFVFETRATFRLTTFDGDADFNSATFAASAYFRSATFNRGANFDSVTFDEDADFNSATVAENVSFNSATFNRSANFESSAFNGSAGFRNVTFNQNAVFNGASFAEGADFTSALFNDDASFSGAKRGGAITFELATFRGGKTLDFLLLPTSKVTCDYWTTDDSLGYSTYAEAIARFIRHSETSPPLSIGIKAQWGGGKTSLMRMVQERLDPPQNKATWKPTTIQLDSTSRVKLAPSTSAAPGKPGTRALRGWRKSIRLFPSKLGKRDDDVAVTNRMVIEATKVANAGSEVSDLDVEPPRNTTSEKWRPTVWFNPWMYQSGEQVWAGLAHEIIFQITNRMERTERELFWLRLNQRRIDPTAIRRRMYRAALERLMPILVVFVLLVPILLLAQTTVLALISGGVGSVLGFVQVARFLGENASGTLPTLLNEPKSSDALLGRLTQESAGSYEELVFNPQYETRVGFLYLMQTDMKRVLDMVATNERPLVVFVDDLDRCSPSTVAQVIEAINLFMAGEFRNCIFILGIEPEAIAAHVEVAYKDLVEKLGVNHLTGETSTLGWHFLEKIVQLPLSVPLPKEIDRMDNYVDSLLSDRVEQEALPTTSIPKTDASEEARVQSENANAPTTEESEGSSTVSVEDEFDELFSDKNPDVREAIIAGAKQLDSTNPRQIKRFVNVFRFYAFIQAHRTFRDDATKEVSLSEVSMEEIAKLAAVIIRWPHLLATFAEPPPSGANGPNVLAYLEDAARGKTDDYGSDSWDQVLANVNLTAEEGENHRSDFEGLRTFLSEGPNVATVANTFL